MILLLDTSTPECRLTLTPDAHVSSTEWRNYSWQADRDLAHHLLKFLHDKLAENGIGFADITAIGAMKGPGSFTGLRIGLTVVNTIARDREIPIVGASGAAWREESLKRIATLENDRLVMPEYGATPHITIPRK